jgi:hypothetical protein
VCSGLTIGGISGKFCVTTSAGERKSDKVPVNDPGTAVAVTGRAGVDCRTACHDGLDVDGDGIVDAQTDGMLIMRHLLGRPRSS